MTTISDVRGNVPYQPSLSPIPARATEWAAIPRVSWPAVFAGAAVVLVVELMLSVLGVGIGASTISPLRGQPPMAAMSIGAGIWFGVTTLVSLFLGGCVAGRLAGVFRHMDGALHGIVAWALSSLVAFYLVTTAVGAVMSGAGTVFGSSAQALGSSVGAAAAHQQATPTPSEDAALRAAHEKADALKAQLPRTAREVGAEAARGVATASLWTFFVLLIGGIAAALGGRVGTDRARSILRHSDVPIS